VVLYLGAQGVGIASRSSSADRLHRLSDADASIKR
jgi:hypothetical protein